MSYLQDFKEDATVRFSFTTNDGAGGRVAPSSAFAASDLRIFKNGSAAQKTSTNGITVTSPFDSMVGVHHVDIDTSNDTDDAGFWVANADYEVVLYPSKTVDGESVSAVVAEFSIENRHNEVDVVKVSGDATAADNLESMYDGTGYTDETAPASRAQLDTIANVGSAQNKPPRDSPDGFVITWGENETNDEDATSPLDGTYHQIEAQDDTGTEKIDVYYEFQLPGSGSPTEVTFKGRLTKVGVSKNLTVHAWNWGTSSWRQIGLLTSSAADVVESYDLFTSEVGTGADSGKVRIRFLTGSVALAATSALYTDQIFVSFATLPQSTAYHDGRVSYDDSASNTNTELGVDGIAGNAVSSWAAVLTLLAALGTKRVAVAAGSSLTLSGNTDAFDIKGSGYSIALGGQSIEGIHIEGAEITGIGTATVTRPHFDRCEFGATTIPPCLMTDCGVGQDGATLTGGSAGEYTLYKCYSLRPGVFEPPFVFTGLGAPTGINNRAWNGGATWTLDSDCTLSHEVVAGGATVVNTGGADAKIRGICEALTIILAASETVQFVGITGAITISGGAVAAVVNLSGVSDGPPADSSTGSTVTDNTISRDSLWTRTRSGELASPPSKTVPSAEDMLAFVYEYFRNRSVSSPSQKVLYKVDATTPLAIWTQSEVAGIFDQDPTA